eukprot:GEZU01018161.1.p2 GENE.GEZU01018161.1~~GEZU01018161.1.p2  ORF type:complete len:143 (+),score=62.66 GEZU01018161.1:489-917(+)
MEQLAEKIRMAEAKREQRKLERYQNKAETAKEAVAEYLKKKHLVPSEEEEKYRKEDEKLKNKKRARKGGDDSKPEKKVSFQFSTLVEPPPPRPKKTKHKGADGDTDNDDEDDDEDNLRYSVKNIEARHERFVEKFGQKKRRV